MPARRVLRSPPATPSLLARELELRRGRRARCRRCVLGTGHGRRAARRRARSIPRAAAAPAASAGAPSAPGRGRGVVRRGLLSVDGAFDVPLFAAGDEVGFPSTCSARQGSRHFGCWSKGSSSWSSWSSGSWSTGSCSTALLVDGNACSRRLRRRARGRGTRGRGGRGGGARGRGARRRGVRGRGVVGAGVAVARGGRRRRVLLVEPGLVGADARPLGPARRLEQLALAAVVEDLVLAEVVLHVGDRRAELVVVPGQRVPPVAVGLAVDRDGDRERVLGRVRDALGMRRGRDAPAGSAEDEPGVPPPTVESLHCFLVVGLLSGMGGPPHRAGSCAADPVGEGLAYGPWRCAGRASGVHPTGTPGGGGAGAGPPVSTPRSRPRRRTRPGRRRSRRRAARSAAPPRWRSPPPR